MPPLHDVRRAGAPTGGHPRVYAVGDNTLDVYAGQIAGTLVGGNALNVAAQLARHGVAVEYAGAIGDDDAGGLIRAAVRDAGVGVRDLVMVQGESAVTTIEVLESGDRIFTSEVFGVTAAYAPADDAVARAASCEWVHIGMIPDASRVRARLKAANPDVVISQDCAVSSGTDNLDVAIWSVGADRAAAEATLASGLTSGPSVVVVTMGADGAIASDGNRVVHQPAIGTAIVDTTGAGDSFIAGFIAARLDGLPLDVAMLTASEWAAATCAHLGGWPQPFVGPAT